jgi:hypothetical protein
MAANFATAACCVQLASGTGVFVEAGATRDTVTDAALIAQFAGNFTASPAVAGVTVTGVQAAYLAAYPRGC